MLCLLVMTSSGKQKAEEVCADKFLIQLSSLLRQADIQLQMCTEYLGTEKIQWQMSIAGQLLHSCTINLRSLHTRWQRKVNFSEHHVQWVCVCARLHVVSCISNNNNNNTITTTTTTTTCPFSALALLAGQQEGHPTQVSSSSGGGGGGSSSSSSNSSSSSRSRRRRRSSSSSSSNNNDDDGD